MASLRYPWHTLAALLLTLLAVALGWMWLRETTRLLHATADDVGRGFAASHVPLADFVERIAPQLQRGPFLTQVMAADGAVLAGAALPVGPDDLLGTLNGAARDQFVQLSTGPALLLLRPLAADGVPVGVLALAAPLPRWPGYAWLLLALASAALWLTLLWRRTRPSTAKPAA